MNRLGELVRERRIAEGIASHKELARRSGVSPSEIDQIERGARKAKSATLAKLAPFLGVAVQELLEAALDDKISLLAASVSRKGMILTAAGSILTLNAMPYLSRQYETIEELAQDPLRNDVQVLTYFYSRHLAFEPSELDAARRFCGSCINRYTDSCHSEDVAKLLAWSYLILGVSFHEAAPCPPAFIEDLYAKALGYAAHDAHLYYFIRWHESIYRRKVAEFTAATQDYSVARQIVDEIVQGDHGEPLPWQRAAAFPVLARIELGQKKQEAFDDALKDGRTAIDKAKKSSSQAPGEGALWTPLTRDLVQVFHYDAEARGNTTLGGTLERMKQVVDAAKACKQALTANTRELLDHSLAHKQLLDEKESERAKGIVLLLQTRQSAFRRGHKKQVWNSDQVYWSKRVQRNIPPSLEEGCSEHRNANSELIQVGKRRAYRCSVCQRPWLFLP